MQVEFDSTKALYVYGRIKKELLQAEELGRTNGVKTAAKETKFLNSILERLEAAFPNLAKLPFD